MGKKLFVLESLIRNYILYPLWAKTGCKLGKHIATSWINGEDINFCEGCKKQLNENMYRRYRVMTNDGELDELVIAINKSQARSFFAGEYHLDNLKAEFKETLPGMTFEQW